MGDVMCSVEGCEGLRRGPHGLCNKHRLRLLRTGRVIHRTTAERFWDFVAIRASDECWPWTGAVSNGYGSFRRVSAHRFSYELSNGPIQDGLFVCHRCDNPPCVNPSHLFLGTNADNMLDAYKKGRLKPPSFRKIPESEEGEIRARLASGERQKAIAVEYGVHPSAISKLLARGEL